MYRSLEQWLTSQGIPAGAAKIIEGCLAIVALLLLIFVSTWIARRYLIPLIEKAIRRSSNKWDDAFVERNFFNRLSLLLPIVITYLSADLMFPAESISAEFIKRLAMTTFVLAGVRILDAFTLAFQDIYSSLEITKGKPVRGYIQAIKIVAYIMAGIFIIAILTNKSPWGILSVLGGLTAVLILVFKDTLLGFVASMQLSAHDMVRVGDWIEMPKYGADGDVFDISIHTVKVRNWDKTIATVPTYALVSDAFKNWRGMNDSGGRRIKRSVHIDMNSICFCTDEMLNRFEKISLVKPYIDAKKKEIAEYNKEHNIDASEIINGRRQTNIGVFRAYVIAYLRNHPKIHQDMTFLVRHLQPTPQGLPVEIYVFSNDQVWANYEGIQADIFDHVLAAIPGFGLKVFQYPSGNDFRGLTVSNS